MVVGGLSLFLVGFVILTVASYKKVWRYKMVVCSRKRDLHSKEIVKYFLIFLKVYDIIRV